MLEHKPLKNRKKGKGASSNVTKELIWGTGTLATTMTRRDTMETLLNQMSKRNTGVRQQPNKIGMIIIQ